MLIAVVSVSWSSEGRRRRPWMKNVILDGAGWSGGAKSRDVSRLRMAEWRQWMGGPVSCRFPAGFAGQASLTLLENPVGKLGAREAPSL